jgi:hypothetical protein
MGLKTVAQQRQEQETAVKGGKNMPDWVVGNPAEPRRVGPEYKPVSSPKRVYNDPPPVIREEKPYDVNAEARASAICGTDENGNFVPTGTCVGQCTGTRQGILTARGQQVKQKSNKTMAFYLIGAAVVTIGGLIAILH